MVDRFVTISPNRVHLTGTVNNPISSSVSIIPDKKYPFKIKDVIIKERDEVRKPEEANIRLKLENNNDGTEYKLLIENLLKAQGQYLYTVSLKADNEKLPEMTISVYGTIN